MNINIKDFPDGFLSFAWDNLRANNRLQLLKDKPKTVWIFGAGASHHYFLNTHGVHVPLANSFFKALNNLPTSEGFHAHVGPLSNYLYRYRGIHPSKTHEYEENIEDFITSVEAEISHLSSRHASRQLNKDEFLKLTALSQAFNNMVFLFANVINESQNGPVSPVFSELLKFCGPNDTFITFNWDSLLDKALASTGCWNPMNDCNINFEAVFDGIWKDKIDSFPILSDKWKLLKLHGSTN